MSRLQGSFLTRVTRSSSGGGANEHHRLSLAVSSATKPLASPFARFSYEGSIDDASLRGLPEDVEKVRHKTKKRQRLESASRSSVKVEDAAVAPAVATSIISEASVLNGGLPEKYCTPGKPEVPLRLLLIGHNPSHTAWRVGHYYAHPSNRMWYLLRETGILPPHLANPECDDLCPWEAGVGFTDLVSVDLDKSDHGDPSALVESEATEACVIKLWCYLISQGSGNPGTKSHEFKVHLLKGVWREDLYRRLKHHVVRAGAAPRVIAFTGKRQYQEMFDKATTIVYGLQSSYPPGWPFKEEECKVFVLTSSSGASALRSDVRLAPYAELAKLLSSLPPWVNQVRATDEAEGSTVKTPNT